MILTICMLFWVILYKKKSLYFTRILSIFYIKLKKEKKKTCHKIYKSFFHKKEHYFFLFSTCSFARAKAKTLADTSFVMVEPAAI